MTIECFEQRYPVMVSANSFWNARRKRLVCPEYTPLIDLDVALDSAGFTAMSQHKRRGERADGIAGVYRWQLSDLMSIAADLGGALSWWAQPDFCCEPEIAADQAERDWRIRATATMLEASLRTVADWQQQWIELMSTSGVDAVTSSGDLRAAELRLRAAQNLIAPPVPVLQGWTTDDYCKSIELLYDVWSRWEPLYTCVLVGIGSVCRRSLHDPVHGIVPIVNAVDRLLPAGIKVHLFGVKSAALAALRDHPRIASVDSMAYDLDARIRARKACASNTMDNRIGSMNAWMTRQAERLAPPPQASFEFAAGAGIPQ